MEALPDGPLYAPMAYLLRLPAKRVRPVGTLMACEMFGGDPMKAIDQAVGIELFHNFTLMHDDIMDRAPLRRGQPTVHVKWDVDRAILSGDAMLVKAYKMMGSDPRILRSFNRAALEVCEGQQMDMDLEQRAEVPLKDYIEMIRLKTAVLLSNALRIGAEVAGASEADRDHLGLFGEYLGISFQLRDDLLDAFGDPDVVGKQRGGDLLAGKKTYLLLRGLELSAGTGRQELQEEMLKGPGARDIGLMLNVLADLGVPRETEMAIDAYHKKAIGQLDAISVPEERKAPFRRLASDLLERAR